MNTKTERTVKGIIFNTPNPREGEPTLIKVGTIYKSFYSYNILCYYDIVKNSKLVCFVSIYDGGLVYKPVEVKNALDITRDEFLKITRANDPENLGFGDWCWEGLGDFREVTGLITPHYNAPI